MNRASKLVFALCLDSAASLAQMSVSDSPLVPLETNCPIGIRATLEKGGNWAPQRLQIILSNWPPLPIIASRVTVHGIAPVADSPEPSEIGEGLDLSRIEDHPRPTAAARKETPSRQGPLAALDDILGPLSEPIIVRVSSPESRWYAWVTGFAAVNSVDLESVRYADGTSWHATDGRPCRVSVGSSVW